MRMRYSKAISTSLALLIPATFPPILGAAQPLQTMVTTAQHRYFVEYHAPNHKGKQVKGPYKSKKHAHAVAHQMRANGIKARVVQR
jgi:hypothetical protein